MRIALLALLAVGCTTGSAARVAVLQHPETKQTVKCAVDPWGSSNFTKQVDNCIAAHKSAGYILVGDSN
jgi:hypothetical protein